MANYVGISPVFIAEKQMAELKQNLLLFDKVGVIMLDYMVTSLKKVGVYPDFKNELEFLIREDLLFSFFDSDEDLKILERTADYQTSIAPLLDEASNIKNDRLAAQLYLPRIASIIYNNEKKDDSVGIPLVPNFSISNDIRTTKTDVINLLIEEIPIPDSNTPWEAIIDFKNDSDSKGRFASLKNWVNKTVKSDYSIGEIKDEIDDLMYQYRKSLDIHKIKHHQGVLQTIIVGSAELIENALRLKFSNIAKGLFQINQGKADLMNLELTAPGNELAYIYQAQNKFQK